MATRKRRALGYETKQCMALMQWARMQYTVHPELRYLIHIPNEGKRSKAAAGIAKAMGLTKGVWDYLLPLPRFCAYPSPAQRAAWYCPGLWLEMKKPKERLRTEQEWWGKEMAALGYCTAVCFDWAQARSVILMYLEGRASHAFRHVPAD